MVIDSDLHKKEDQEQGTGQILELDQFFHQVLM